jgi:hypothetical protein
VTAPTTNHQLAARARQLAAAAPNSSAQRKASLVAAVCLAEASTPAGARKILRAWEGAPPAIRDAAVALIEQLATDHPAAAGDRAAREGTTT